MAIIGRPLTEISKNEFEKLCGLHCTEIEIAAWFSTSVDTLNRWCKRQYKGTFAEVYNIYKAKGKISIRRNQFKLSEKNAGMAIWLGKVYLNQHVNEFEGAETKLNETLENMSVAFRKDI